MNRCRTGSSSSKASWAPGSRPRVRFIATSLEEAKRRAQPIQEMTTPHPIRATDELAHWFQPWLDVTPVGLAERSLSKWRSFVDSVRTVDTVPVLDGQLFHGDLTNLFLMDAGFHGRWVPDHRGV
jgi:hypothetical protein